MEEIWKNIIGYERYQISSFGNVRSLNYRSKGEIKNLTPKKNCKGYLWVILYGKKHHRCALIHRLVAEAFLENSNDFPVINHKDENPLNNNVDNLEWCTRSYNVRYSIDRHPNRAIGRRARNGRKAIPYKHTCQIIQLNKSNQIVKTWANVSTITNEMGWRGSSIVDVCKGNRKTAYGYIWQYANDDISVRENAI